MGRKKKRDNDVYDAIAANIKNYRKAAGITQEQLADLTSTFVLNFYLLVTLTSTALCNGIKLAIFHLNTLTVYASFIFSIESLKSDWS